MTRPDRDAYLEPRDREEWTRWLEEHHATSPGTWLAIGKKDSTRTALTYDAAVEEALRFGWIDSTVNRLDSERFVQLYTPRRPRGTWSRSNKERVARLEAEGLMRPAGIAAVEAARANGSWDLLTDAEAGIVPDDLARALEAVPAAADAFAALPPSRRSQLIYWVTSARREQTRATRIERVAEALAEDRWPV